MASDMFFSQKERPNSTMLHKCAHRTLKPKTLLVVNPG
jgi:hypothetical protein